MHKNLKAFVFENKFFITIYYILLNAKQAEIASTNFIASPYLLL